MNKSAVAIIDRSELEQALQDGSDLLDLFATTLYASTQTQNHKRLRINILTRRTTFLRLLFAMQHAESVEVR